MSVDDQIRDLSAEPAFDESALAMFGDESHAIKVGRFLLRHGPELAGWPAQTVPDSRQDAPNR